MSTPPFVVKPVNWHVSREALQTIRRTVFIEEQNVPEELEWDDADERSYHVLACTPENVAIGTGRLLLSCEVGRMAVLKEWRRRGVGSAILKVLLHLAKKEGCGTIELNAQTHAIGFYEKHGFVATGREFLDAGILHRRMQIRL
ncbi:MAG TPA: GNAT family N-acetyltransferase [Burkholderiales bacterium]|nr:GNAT family N-acetyltransferase [Burkholderiales bacterium]